MRQTRFAVVTAALALGAFAVSSTPAAAEPSATPIAQSVANMSFATPADSSFLIKGLAPSKAEAAQQNSNGSSRHEGIGIGAEAGLTFASASSANLQNFNNKTGVEAGIFFGGNRPGLIGVMGKLMYVKEGANSTDGVNGANLAYLEIPVLMRVNIGSSSLNGLLFYGVAGPSFDLLLKGTSVADNTDIKKQFSTLNLGVQVGGGVEITRFIIEANYTTDVKNVIDGNLAKLNDIKTHKFAIDFGIRFN